MQTLLRPSDRPNDSKRTLFRELGTSTVRFTVHGKMLTMSTDTLVPQYHRLIMIYMIVLSMQPLPVGFDKIGPFFWHFMLLALPFFWPNYANFYALLAEKCSLMLDILNSNSVKHDLTINLITMAEYVPSMAAKIAGTLSYECIPTSIQSHAQRTTGTYYYIVMHMYRSC